MAPVRDRRGERGVVLLLFLLFAVTQAAYLSRVPGLMGDEASEGENVYELWSGGKNYFAGERSYIGPAIDYMRMPFFAVIKHPVLALRSVTLLAALASFWLAVIVFRRLFGEQAGLLAATAMLFSPVFVLEQRMAWTITLTPFFALLTLYFVIRKTRGAAALAGVAAGLGLSNHIMFLPTLVGLLVAFVFYYRMRLGLWTLAAVGFMVAFATQAWQLFYSTAGDQGEPRAVAELFWDRLRDLPKLLPLLVSGSSYVARYTGVEFRAAWQYGIAVLILGLVLMALLRGKRAVWLWFSGTMIQLVALLVIIDRFSLRYFVPTMLAVWALAGLGLAGLLERLGPVKSRRWWDHEAAIVLAVGLTIWMVVVVLVPFLRTGGSTDVFSLANRTDSASALVDVRPLVICLQGPGTVTSESVHIFNRLWYLRHYEPSIQVVPEGEVSQWLVNYRFDPPAHEATAGKAGGLCPELTHFRIEKR